QVEVRPVREVQKTEDQKEGRRQEQKSEENKGEVEEKVEPAHLTIEEEEWKLEYRLDREYKTYIKYLEEGKKAEGIPPETWKKFQKREGSVIWEDNILKHRGKVGNRTVEAIIVPYKFRGYILWQFHDSPEGGNRNPKATMAK